MPNDVEEYVLNESGVIYRGNYRNIAVKNWNYGQVTICVGNLPPPPPPPHPTQKTKPTHTKTPNETNKQKKPVKFKQKQK